MKDTSYNPNIRDENLLALRTLAGVFFAVGGVFAVFIFTGLDAGSAMWLYGACGMWTIGAVLGGVAQFLKHRGVKDKGREPVIAIAKSA